MTEDSTSLFIHLFNFSQKLYGQTQGVADRFCEEVTRATQGCVQLLLRRQWSSNSDRMGLSSSTMSISFLVQFYARVYGVLCIAPDPESSTSPVLSLPEARLLAQICGLFLYTLEVSAFLENQSPRLDSQAEKSLTKRERQVLMLMCRGYDGKAIAKDLSIELKTVAKHRQHIYEKLGVCNEHDALLRAFQLGLFSPFEELM